MAGTGITGVIQDTNKNNLLTSSKMDTALKPPVPRPRNPDRKKSADQTQEKNIKVSQTDQHPPSEKPKLPMNKPIKPPKSASLVPSPVTDQPKPIVKVESNQERVESSKTEVSNKQPKIMNEIKKEEEPVKPVATENEQKPLKLEEETLSIPPPMIIKEEPKPEPIQEIIKPNVNKTEEPTKTEEINDNPLENAEMTASMIAKTRITTEEEAKAALAERRRLAREEAERQALAEKLRQEQEEERQRQEEEQLRKLAEEQRKAEEERLAQVRDYY